MSTLNHGSIRGRVLVSAFACAAVLIGTGTLIAQSDPGPRGGAAGAGDTFATLTPTERAFFTNALDIFQEVDSVSGTIPGEDGSGLGPTFNGNSCVMCHAQPAVGGTSPGLKSKQKSVPNPQIALATLHGAQNTIPSFITADGPTREARFIAGAGGALDGGVHGLFTIRGRTDANGCTMDQPNFAEQLTNKNVSFRIPTPGFGLGLVESTPDATLRANLATNQPLKNYYGIRGAFNMSGNDGTITRFGWKAQNKSLMVFAGEAYNVEQGVSNDVFVNERSAIAGCVYNGSPEDSTKMNPRVEGSTEATEEAPDTLSFATFMRLLAPPVPTTASSSEKAGESWFNSVGCALCHSPTLTTGQSRFTALSGVTYHPYSDFALHHMGSNLADGVLQGSAGPDEFRTAPLWGIGQRLFFLHDGRTSDLLEAIQAHASTYSDCTSVQSSWQFKANGAISQPYAGDRSCGSEANSIITRFNTLTADQQQDLLNFLRSL